MMALRKMAPGGYEYLTRHVACGDHELTADRSIVDVYAVEGYPPGEWFGTGAAVELGVSGQVTTEQMQALFAEGRHPNADQIEADALAAGDTAEIALWRSRLGRQFPRFEGVDDLRSQVIAAYKQHNRDLGRAETSRIDPDTRATIRTRVQTDAFIRAHDGRGPRDLTELRSWLTDQTSQRKQAVSGYECVFAPPNSVSIAWALSDADTRERITAIHRQAVTDAITHLESNAAFTRQGEKSEAQVDMRGLTAALFEHWDSRAGDPHLHTHVPISAKVRRDDGDWTSLDGRTIHAAAVTVSEYYDARVRDLFREHGASWTQRPRDGIDAKRPVWELDGVSDQLLRGFAQRTQQVETERAQRIVAFRAEHGREPSPSELYGIKWHAQYQSRGLKQAPRSLNERVDQWRREAHTFAPSEQVETLGSRVFSSEGEQVERVDVTRMAAAVRHTVSEYHAHFTRWNLEAEAYRQTAGTRIAGARDELVAAIADEAVNASDTVSIQAPSLVPEPTSLRRASGESVFTVHNAQRYTTEDTLRKETHLVQWARETGGLRVSAPLVDQALNAAPRLNHGQRELVASFARSGQRVQLAMAPAGSGKTTAMRTFADAWRSAGGRVYAFGPSARAAQELGESLAAEPHTLHQLTTLLDAGGAEDRFGFRRGDVLVVDEAAMAGTHTLHRVVDYALARGAQVRLVGDDHQLSAVEAGGAVRLIATDVGAVRLHEIMRFADPQQAQASLQLRRGDPTALTYYLQQDWVRGGSRETMRAAAQQAWRADLDAGRQTLLIVPMTDDVVALNRQARAQRQARGAVASDRGVLLHDGTAASRGDWIVTRDNNRTLRIGSRGKDFVKNGDTWHIHAIGRDGAMQVSHRAHGGRTVLPADYAAEHVELAYATTIHRTQGMTVRDTAHHLTLQRETREQFYTAMTRSQHNNYAYVETHHHTADAHQETPHPQRVEAVLFGVLQHVGAPTSATEELRHALGREESLATLVTRHTYGAHLGSRQRHEELVALHATPAVGQPGEEELLRTLQHAEDRGWQPERLLPQLTAWGSVDSADDPAALLYGRLKHHLEHHEPPARTLAPDEDQLTRWRSLVDDITGPATTSSPEWDLVWRHAAAGAADGLDAEAALSVAATELTQRPDTDPMDEHRYVAQALVDHVAEQRLDGAGWNSALPWMARPHESVQSVDTELAEYLRAMDTAMHTRLDELRTDVTEQQPDWTAGLGPRPGPDQPERAEQWDELAGLAAAYRETYTITTQNPDAPLGGQPDDSSSPQAQAWHQITDQWSPVTTTSDNTHQNTDSTANEVLHQHHRTTSTEHTEDDDTNHLDHDQRADLDHDPLNDDEDEDMNLDSHSGSSMEL